MASSTLKPVSPTDLCHVVLQTTPANFEPMIQFYLTALNATVVHQTHSLCFVAYDDKHHGIALAANEALTPKDPARPQVGMHHIAFGFPRLADLADGYEYRASQGIRPVRCLNHGISTSMYYADPDGNQVELQVNSFDTPDETTAYMASPAFVDNPNGVEFDADEFLRRVRSGLEDDAAIKQRPEGGE
ncbi:Glyoxalase/Bleomycin resistance protein/Dihydroxybiphenyl dioxygenase [Apiospora arundinis]